MWILTVVAFAALRRGATTLRRLVPWKAAAWATLQQLVRRRLAAYPTSAAHDEALLEQPQQGFAHAAAPAPAGRSAGGTPPGGGGVSGDERTAVCYRLEKKRMLAEAEEEMRRRAAAVARC